MTETLCVRVRSIQYKRIEGYIHYVNTSVLNALVDKSNSEICNTSTCHGKVLIVNPKKYTMQNIVESNHSD